MASLNPLISHLHGHCPDVAGIVLRPSSYHTHPISPVIRIFFLRPRIGDCVTLHFINLQSLPSGVLRKSNLIPFKLHSPYAAIHPFHLSHLFTHHVVQLHLYVTICAFLCFLLPPPLLLLPPPLPLILPPSSLF